LCFLEKNYSINKINITTRNLANTNRNTNRIVWLVDCGDLYRQTFRSLNPSVNTDGNILSVYTEGIAVEKEEIKIFIKIRWRITFTDIFTDGINSTVKFVCKYTDRNNPSVYTDRITDNIAVGFKKATRMVTWHILPT
jgi:hypothetical protein